MSALAGWSLALPCLKGVEPYDPLSPDDPEAPFVPYVAPAPLSLPPTPPAVVAPCRPAGRPRGSRPRRSGRRTEGQQTDDGDPPGGRGQTPGGGIDETAIHFHPDAVFEFVTAIANLIGDQLAEDLLGVPSDGCQTVHGMLLSNGDPSPEDR